MKEYLKKTLIACASALALTVTAQARDQIRIVGSSTVYPFASAVAEEFGATTKYPTPVVESTGSGGGHKLFGAGVGDDTPDITDSSRRMKKSEFLRAQKNGIRKITEVVIGYDGIALAFNKQNPPMNLTLEQIFRAVAKQVPIKGKLVDNPYTRWSDIDPSLPKTKILIFGPPTTSGTRDAFHELVMHKVAKRYKDLYAPVAHKAKYQTIRDDGAYVEAGENDNLIVQKLEKDPSALGIFGYSFLEENQDRIQGASVDGIAPEPESISSGRYPISRSLYFYVKDAHLKTVPGLKDYVQLFVTERMIGPRGYLKRIGLIPLPDEMRRAVRERVRNWTPLTLSDFE